MPEEDPSLFGRARARAIAGGMAWIDVAHVLLEVLEDGDVRRRLEGARVDRMQLARALADTLPAGRKAPMEAARLPLAPAVRTLLEATAARLGALAGAGPTAFDLLAAALEVSEVGSLLEKHGVRKAVGEGGVTPA